MSMTREEAIALLNDQYETCKRIYDCSADQRKSYPNVPQFMEALGMALTALRPVSREQVEKSWAGCEYCEKHKINLVRIEMNYNDSPGSPKRLNPTRVPKFCPMCGRPLTDEAVQMVIDRLEALKDEAY